MSEAASVIRAPSSDFPSDVLKWMKANAKPKMALKLMKCHKYFQHFPEFPYLIFKDVSYYDDRDEWSLKTLNNQSHIHQDLKSIENYAKQIWITGYLILNQFPELASRLFTKIAVCDIEHLTLYDQTLSFEKFEFLTASGTITECHLYNTKFKFNNGDPVFIDSILKCLPNVESFLLHNDECPVFTSNFINIYKDIDASKMKEMDLQMISFPYFLIFLKFMEHNPHIKYELDFIPNSLSKEETKTIENFIDKIIYAGITKYPPPIIEFPEQPLEQLEALKLMSLKYEKQNK